ncbi:MAG: class I SAM-dependent methyltransferase [Caulobacter sp.]|nr:class I SAM-dependent methyltransferase [Caulobacter sp.]
MRCPLCERPGEGVLTRQLRGGPGEVRWCESCRLGFIEAPDQDSLAAFYATEYRKLHGPVLGRVSDPEETFQTHVGQQGGRLKLLAPHLRPSFRVLEVGCSTGHFLYHVKPLVAEVVGVDYNPEHAAWAAARLGCRTFGEGLEKAGLESGSFDVVCAFQTLEHVADPVAFVGVLASHLRPGGLLMIEVPNLHDLLLSVFDVPRYQSFFYHSAHLLYFTRESLAAVMARAGFAGEVVFTQDYNLTNHLNWIHTDQPQPTGAMGLGPARLPNVREDLEPALREDLDRWLAEADAAYRALLARHGKTDNMTFLGRRDGGP